MKKEVTKEKDFSVELLRVVACYIVICVHVKLPDMIGANYDLERIFVSCLCADGVAVFLLITGFFLFKNESFRKVLIRTGKSIVLPAILVMGLSIVLEPWIMNTNTLVGTLKEFDFEKFSLLWQALIEWQPERVPLSNHLWYIATYVECILWFPLLKLTFGKGKEKIKVRYYLLFLWLLLFLAKDIYSVLRLEIFHITTYSVLTSALGYFLLGHELYERKDFIRGNKRFFYGGMLFFLFGNMIRAIFQKHIYNVPSNDIQLLMWNSFFGGGMALALSVSILSLKVENNWIKKAISCLGEKTFGIYLIHWSVIHKLGGFSFYEQVLGWFGGGETLVGMLGYIVVYASFIFAVSFLITSLASIIWKGIKRMVKSVWKHIENHLQNDLISNSRESVEL